MTNAERCKKRREIGKEYALKYLGRVCIKCGSKDKLVFDHINPNNKTFRIAIGFGYSKYKLTNELDKCQLLCIKCHWEKTRKELGCCVDSLGNSSTHGSVNYYINMKCHCNLCKSAWNKYFLPKKREYRKNL